MDQITTQFHLERLIKQWGFMPFFKNGIEGFSIQEITPPELLFGDDFDKGPWQWKGPIIANWECAYGKFFGKKAGYVSLEWLPDFINWRRSLLPLHTQHDDARHILEVLVANESMLSKRLKVESGFTLSRRKKTFNPDDPTQPIVNRHNGTTFDALIAQLQMGTYVCIADFEYQVSRTGETYGWGVARYCYPEAMYPGIFPVAEHVDGRTPEQSRQRIIDHISRLFPDAAIKQIERLI